MSTARVFRSGNSQAVRLPKEFRFNSEEVEIFRRGDEVVLREKTRDMQRAYQLLTELPEDFLRDGRSDIPPQTRKALSAASSGADPCSVIIAGRRSDAAAETRQHSAADPWC
jgi:antitoxin VapB